METRLLEALWATSVFLILPAMIFVRKAHVMECSVKLSAGILLLRELTDEVGAALHRLIFFDKKKKKI